MAAVGQAVSAMSVREQQARDPTPMAVKMPCVGDRESGAEN